MKPTRRRQFRFAQEFTKTPGGRLRIHGKFSGEEFREVVLDPAFAEGTGLDIDMTGTLGVGSSFLDESFGKFAATHGKDATYAFFRVRSASNEFLEADVRDAIESAAGAA